MEKGKPDRSQKKLFNWAVDVDSLMNPTKRTDFLQC